MVAIVSAYYKIPTGKCTHEKYIDYIKLFFNFFRGKRVIFFTDSFTLDEFHEKDINTAGIEFILKNFKDLPILTKFPYSFWERQIERDVEHYHTPELGIIWASKKEFIREASELLPNENWFAWMDAGCVRTPEWMSFSKDFGTRGILQNPGIYVTQLNRHIPKKEFFTYPDVFIGGGLNVFHRNFIKIFCDSYDAMLRKYDEAKVCATSDQYIICSLMHNNTSIIPIHHSNCKIAIPDTEWFFFLGYI